MSSKPGKTFTRQSDRPPLVARNLNQIMPAAEALSRLTTGRGLAYHDLPGGIPAMRAIGIEVAYARIGPDGIDGADFSDPELIVPGMGFVLVYVRTADGLKAKGNLEECENVFHGDAPAGWFPVIVAKIDGEVWTIVAPDCINEPLP